MIALIAAIAAASPALAAESGADPDLWAPQSPPVERGKPMIVMPPAMPEPDASHCLPVLPCGTRLYGAVEKNGAVELKVPALRW